MAKIIVSVCMGSSCFPRGNREILSYLKLLVQKNNWESEITLQGNLCAGNCAKGPVVTIAGTVYTEVSILTIEEIIMENLQKRGQNESA